MEILDGQLSPSISSKDKINSCFSNNKIYKGNYIIPISLPI